MGRSQTFVHFSVVFSVETSLYNRKSMSLSFFLFCNFGGILSRPTTFRLNFFFNITSNSSSIVSFSLMSSGYKYFLTDWWVTLERFSSRFLKCSFHFHSLSSWLITFSFTFEKVFLHLLSTMLIFIISLLPSFWFYWFGFECILVFFFTICLFSLGFLKFLHIGSCRVSFIKQQCFFFSSYFDFFQLLFTSMEIKILPLGLVDMQLLLYGR